MFCQNVQKKFAACGNVIFILFYRSLKFGKISYKKFILLNLEKKIIKFTIHNEKLWSNQFYYIKTKILSFRHNILISSSKYVFLIQ